MRENERKPEWKREKYKECKTKEKQKEKKRTLKEKERSKSNRKFITKTERQFIESCTKENNSLTYKQTLIYEFCEKIIVGIGRHKLQVNKS